MLIATPGPSGAVTIATVSQTFGASGIDVRSWTLRSATTPGAVTCAEPVRRRSAAGHDVRATSTVPVAGFGGVVSVAPPTIEVVARVPAGPAGPVAPAGPTAPATPWSPGSPFAPGARPSGRPVPGAPTSRRACSPARRGRLRARPDRRGQPPRPRGPATSVRTVARSYRSVPWVPFRVSTRRAPFVRPTGTSFARTLGALPPEMSPRWYREEPVEFRHVADPSTTG